MNYTRIYEELISSAIGRPQTNEYTEDHHIIPKCIGGSDSPENIVPLSAREHFVAHQLLAKIHGGGLIHAAHMMSNMGKYSSRDYVWLRVQHAEKMSDVFSNAWNGDQTARKEKLYTNERNEKVSVALTGTRKSNSHIENWKASRLNGAGWVCSEERKSELSISMTGKGNPMWRKDHTEEAKEKIRTANRQKIECPHCGKIGGIAIMKRWHFKNCKNRLDE